MEFEDAVDRQELRDGELHLDLFAIATHIFHKVPTAFFRMLVEPGAAMAGQINLRVGATRHIELYAGHVGYEVYERYRGHRYAARSLRLLIPCARRLGIDPIWITCDPGNAASRRSLELAGARLVETVDVPENCCVFAGGHPRKCRYRL